MSSGEQNAIMLEHQLAIPAELVLDILESTARIYRVEALQWSLSLLLISRTVRRTILPILYETLVIDVRSSEERTCVGWDGRERTIRMSFLAWLLHDPDAPPRRHVKHLVFRHHAIWDHSELFWSTSGISTKETGCWTVDQLTIRWMSDAERLYNAGLRAAHACHVKVINKKLYNEPSAIFAATIARNLPVRPELESAQGLLIHTWAVARDHHGYRQRVILRSDINMMLSPPEPLLTVRDTQTNPLIVQLQLMEGDRFLEKPEWLLKDVVALLQNRPLVSVVLVCDSELRIAGHTIRDYVTSAPATTLPPQLLTRLRISHAVWNAEALEEDPFLLYMKIFRRGESLWDLGSSIECS